MESSTFRAMRSGPLSTRILLFSLPLMASNILQVLFNMADIAVVGQFSEIGRASCRERV